MTLPEICELVAARLPQRYEHLKLTFYGRECRPNGDHVVIGDDYGTNLCVRLDDGSIFAVDPTGKLPTRFVNSGIEELARFIDVAESFAGTRLDSESLARQMREALAAIDPRAFAETSNWWAVLLETI